MKTSNDLLKTIKTYGIITLGLFINAMGWAAFLIPAKIVGGGISGVATLIFYGTDVPVAFSYLAINSLLLVIAIKLLGANFGIKTIYSVLVLSGFFWILQHLITEPIITEGFMSTVLGGALAGAGVGIVFSQGGSTGGTDIIAMIINRWRNISPGKVILYCDILIIGSSYFVFKSIESLVYGFVSMSVVAYTIDLILNGSKQSVQLMIISEQHDEIARRISNEIKRGATLVDGKGWYTQNETKIIITIVRKHEVQHIHRIVKEVDANAFISQAAVMGVYGKGFEEIRG